MESTRELLWERGYVGTSPKATQLRSGAARAACTTTSTASPTWRSQRSPVAPRNCGPGAEAEFAGPGTAVERVTAYLRREREILKGCPAGRLTQDPDVMADPELRRPVGETFAWLTSRLAGLLAEGCSNGELDAGLDPGATATALVAVLQGGYVLARAAHP